MKGSLCPRRNDVPACPAQICANCAIVPLHLRCRRPNPAHGIQICGICEKLASFGIAGVDLAPRWLGDHPNTLELSPQGLNPNMPTHADSGFANTFFEFSKSRVGFSSWRLVGANPSPMPKPDFRYVWTSFWYVGAESIHGACPNNVSERASQIWTLRAGPRQMMSCCCCWSRCSSTSCLMNSRWRKNLTTMPWPRDSAADTAFSSGVRGKLGMVFYGL